MQLSKESIKNRALINCIQLRFETINSAIIISHIFKKTFLEETTDYRIPKSGREKECKPLDDICINFLNSFFNKVEEGPPKTLKPPKNLNNETLQYCGSDHLYLG